MGYSFHSFVHSLVFGIDCLPLGRCQDIIGPFNKVMCIDPYQVTMYAGAACVYDECQSHTVAA